jgi:hypothetical protein
MSVPAGALAGPLTYISFSKENWEHCKAVFNFKVLWGGMDGEERGRGGREREGGVE